MSLVKGVYDASQRGDIASILDVLADAVEWRTVAPASLPYPRECRTKQQVADCFKAMAESDDVTAFEPREIIDAGDHVIALGFMRATSAVSDF
ncbi:nuclear transport factor 2 family protein [Paraburkholderia sp. MM5477-R1]|uniref:nuclear transport factor 2 family protein n=1 Tax=Paraburkholderia sp. MM5477-R1 TaxID=2991062 RepID=UPI003D19EF48